MSEIQHLIQRLFVIKPVSLHKFERRETWCLGSRNASISQWSLCEFFLSFCNLPAQYARPLLTYNVSIPDMLVPLLQHRTYTLAMLDIRVLLRKPSTFEHFFSGCFTNLPPLHKFSAFSRALNRFISFQPLRGLSITLRTFAYIVSLQSFSA